MPKGIDRWLRRDLRHRFPVIAERQHSPRFDGLYLSTDDPESIFLLCAAVAGGRESRSQLELRFRQRD
jgi:hypothetical protein